MSTHQMLEEIKEKMHLAGSIYDDKKTRFAISQCGFYRENYDLEQELCDICVLMDDDKKNRNKLNESEIIHLLKANFSSVEDLNENLVTIVLNTLAILKGEKTILQKKNDYLEKNMKSFEEKIDSFNKMNLFKKMRFIIFEKKV